MYARNVTERNLQDVARSLGFEAKTELVRDNYIKFNLVNHSDKYHVVHRGFNEKTKTMRTKVCFHGYWLFIANMLDVFHDVVIDAGYYGKVRYTAETFEKNAAEIGDTVVRQWDMLRVRDKCNCEPYVEQDWEFDYAFTGRG